MLALVNGNFQFDRGTAAPRRRVSSFFPLGLLSLQAYTRAASAWEVAVLNPPALACREGQEASAIADFLDSVEGRALGISVTALSLPPVLAALRRRRRRGQRVILGGPGLQGLPRGFLNDFPQVDVVIYGEGERPLAEALKRFEGREVPIPSASYRSANHVVHSFEPARLPSLDLVPPAAYSELLPAGAKQIITESSRGCPFRCVFCSSPGVWGNRVTTRSAGRIVADLRRLTDELGPLLVIFVDDLFTVSHRRVSRLCEELRAAALPVRWVCFGRIETVDEALLQSMRTAGCHAISFGVEAGSDRVLRLLGKGFSARQAREVLSAAKAILPVVEASFIKGFPFETVAEFRDTLDLMEHCHEAGCHTKLYTLTPLLGTLLSRKYGRSWRFDPHYRNPSLSEWFPVSSELRVLFEQFPYLAWPFGYFDYREREEKDAMSLPWTEEDHTLAGRDARAVAASV